MALVGFQEQQPACQCRFQLSAQHTGGKNVTQSISRRLKTLVNYHRNIELALKMCYGASVVKRVCRDTNLLDTRHCCACDSTYYVTESMAGYSGV